mgnify:FL=1
MSPYRIRFSKRSSIHLNHTEIVMRIDDVLQFTALPTFNQVKIHVLILKPVLRAPSDGIHVGNIRIKIQTYL